jgi:hypothetical protein
VSAKRPNYRFELALAHRLKAISHRPRGAVDRIDHGEECHDADDA